MDKQHYYTQIPHINKAISMQWGSKKGYWYCCEHNNAFYMNMSKTESPTDYQWSTECCVSSVNCALVFIGSKIFNRCDTVIKYDTPKQSFYDTCGGGFKAEYLSNVPEIYLSKTKKNHRLK